MLVITEVPLTCHYSSSLSSSDDSGGRCLKRHLLKRNTANANFSTVASSPWDVRYKERGTFLSDDGSVTTGILPQEPHVLQVVIRDRGVLELDLQQVLSTGLVAVTVRQKRNVLELLALDLYGDLLIYNILQDDLDNPMEQYKIVSMATNINNTTLSCACFLAETVTLVGISPYLFTWDYETQQMVHWSSDEDCLYNYNSNHKNWTNIWNKATGMWMGQPSCKTKVYQILNAKNILPNNNGLIPVAALSALYDDDKQPCGVLTLYANGALKLWTCPSADTRRILLAEDDNAYDMSTTVKETINPWMYPEQCREISTTSNGSNDNHNSLIPLPSTWSPEWDSVSMLSTYHKTNRYDGDATNITRGNFTLVLGIRTAWSWLEKEGESNTNENNNSNSHHLVWVQGSIPSTATTSAMISKDKACRCMTSQSNHHHRVGWAFSSSSPISKDKNHKSNLLHLLWWNNNSTTNSMLLESFSFSTQQEETIVIQPHIAAPTQEDCHNQTIVIPNFHNEDLINSSVEEQLETIHAFYMKQLFVPIGGSPPPSICVNMALSSLYYTSTSSNNSNNIEYDTLMAMRAVSISSMSNQSKTRLSISPTSETTPKSSDKKESSSIYYRYRANNNSNSSNAVALMDRTATPTPKDDDLQKHECDSTETMVQRWKALIKKVRELEKEFYQTPLGLIAVNNSLCLVRTGSWNALVTHHNSPSPTSASFTNNTTLSQIQCQLDQLAVTLYQHANKSSFTTIQQLEQSVNRMIPQMMGGCFVVGPQQDQQDKLKRSCMYLGFQTSNQILSDTTFRQTLLPLWKSLTTTDQDCWTWLHRYSTSTTTTATGLFQLVHNNKPSSTPPMNNHSSDNTTMMGIVQAAASVTRLSLNHIRQMALARALLLGALHLHSQSNNSNVNPQPLDAAWRSYLHVSTIQWVNSQYCCTPNNTYKPSSSSSLSSSAPRQKIPPPRAFTPLKGKTENHSTLSSHNSNNNDDDHTSLQKDRQDISRPRHLDQTTNMTNSKTLRKGTLLEVRLLQIAKPMVERNYSTDPTSVLALSHVFLQLAFSPSTNISELPELAILPNSFHHRKRYALRLLAPFIAYPIQGQQKMTTTFVRNEMAAECLLAEAKYAFESSFQARVSKAHQLPSHFKELCTFASDLLLKNAPPLQYSDTTNLEEALEILRQVPDGWSVHRLTPSSSEYYDSFIFEFIRNLLQDNGDENYEPIMKDKNFILEDEHLQLLANMQTVKLLLLPWIVTAKNAHVDPLSLILNNSNYEDNSGTNNGFNSTNATASNNNSLKNSIRELIWILLRICVLIHRVALLERHTLPTATTASSITAVNDTSKTILSAVKDAIDAIEEYLPERMYQELMVEYAILWSSSFRHANLAQEWNHAFNACLSNPIKSRRINNFRRLVIAMVDTGHLKQLLDIVPISVVKDGSSSSLMLEDREEKNDDNPNNSMDIEAEVDGNVVTSSSSKNTTGGLDFYELAVETLVEASIEQSRSAGRSYFGTNRSSSKTNYKGCLYALHAACGNWRRATQAMDLYGVLSMTNISDEKEGRDEEPPSPKIMAVSSKEIMSDVSLSALASAHVIQLVDNLKHRFIVSGELGPYPVPPCFRDASSFNSNEIDEPSDTQRKRSRDSDMIFASPTVVNGSDGSLSNRLSHLLTESSLMNRAVKMMVMKTLHLDPKSPDSILSLIKSSDLEAIDMSARLGYYHHGLTLARCRLLQQQGIRRGGRDFVADALGYILTKYLSVVAIKSTRPQPYVLQFEDSVLGSEDIENNGYISRPTTFQLGHMSMGSNMSPFTLTKESWRSLGLRENSIKGQAAMSLLELFTKKYSNSGNSLAVEVAGRLLDLDEGRAELPLWIQGLLLGNDDNNDSGLFAINNMKASQSSTSFADPGALVRLYMKRGLYVSACNVITSTLLGSNNNKKKAASSRLPEKGNIDYVPYHTIDILWNLIEEKVNEVIIDAVRKNDMLEARTKMQQALETHFELMQLSEKGMHSARILESS